MTLSSFIGFSINPLLHSISCANSKCALSGIIFVKCFLKQPFYGAKLFINPFFWFFPEKRSLEGL